MEVQHGLYLCSSDRGKVEILDKRLGLHHKCPKRRLDLSQRSQFLEIIVELPLTNQAGLHEDLMTKGSVLADVLPRASRHLFHFGPTHEM